MGWNIIRTYSNLGKAYAVKEALRDFYSLGDPENAKYFPRSLIIYCKNSGLEDVRSLDGMLESHYAGILFWHSYKVTNGAAEGRNSVIQGMKATSRGYANVDNMISMVYLKNTLDHPSYLTRSSEVFKTHSIHQRTDDLDHHLHRDQETLTPQNGEYIMCI